MKCDKCDMTGCDKCDMMRCDKYESQAQILFSFHFFFLE